MARNCKKCGQDNRSPSGNCRACSRDYTNKWRQKNKEAILQRQRERYYRNWDLLKARRKERYTYNRGHVLERYGITPQEYDQRLAAQEGVCAICGKYETAKQNGHIRALAVDHDHKTGKVRGLLCHRCNHGLGCFRDNLYNLIKAIHYLRDNSGP